MEKIKFILGDKDHAKEIRNYFDGIGCKNADFYNYVFSEAAYFVNPDTRCIGFLDTDEWMFKAFVEAGIFEELKYPYIKPKLRVIKGVPCREVIEFLESLGGKNEKDLVGYAAEYYYFIDDNGCICCESMRSDFFDKFDLEILTLPEKVEKPKLQVIRGDLDRGADVIALLEGLGGSNVFHYWGNAAGAYYYLDSDKAIRWDHVDDDFFTDYDLEILPLPEKPAESAVFTYPNEEPMILEPFVTKVLVRTYHDPCWIPGFFFSEESDGDTNEYHIVGSSFSYDECVPYEGNEHLAYTSNDVRIE